MRVPCIAWWPGKVPARSTCAELTTTMDVLPTLAALAGVSVAPDRPVDGHNIWPLLSGQSQARSPYEAFYYYYMDQLQAVRSGPWKLYLALPAQRANLQGATRRAAARLYQLDSDPAEKNNLVARHPDIVARLARLAARARDELGDGSRHGRGQRPAGHVDHPRPLVMAN